MPKSELSLEQARRSGQGGRETSLEKMEKVMYVEGKGLQSKSSANEGARCVV